MNDICNNMEYYNRFVHDQDDSPETAIGSPLSGDDTTLTDAPSPKKRRIAGKRVVTVAIADGDVYPPADSWAWRKYGQKPIKGSPYPRSSGQSSARLWGAVDSRGYYRCSSSKGCPARKQVERSRKDPTVVVITYACEHNHLISTTTKHSQTTTTIPAKFPPEEFAVFANQPDLEPDNIDFAEFVADFGYFTNITSVILESPVTTSPRCMEPDTAVIFTRGDDEDSLFADLGELPGCSLIFQQREE